MISPRKKYIIDGWAINALIDIIKLLKTQIQKTQSEYSNDDFLDIIDRYDFVITYLLKLDVNKKHQDTYSEDVLSDELIELLTKYKISFGNDLDETDEPME